MGERKVLNKYYPPDFDPSAIPRGHRPKDNQFKVRLMAPFNMRCLTCGRYIYKATKFNARKENTDEDYLGIRIFRFYIRCPACSSEITFKTDPQNTDYTVELGATRNFDHWHENATAKLLADKRKETEEEGNPMKALENRIQDSKREMDILDELEELKEKNDRYSLVNHESLIDNKIKTLAEEQSIEIANDEEEIEKYVRKVFGSTADGQSVKRRYSSPEGEEESREVQQKAVKLMSAPATDVLTEKKAQTGDLSKNKLSKAALKSLVKPKVVAPPPPVKPTAVSSTLNSLASGYGSDSE